MSNNPYFSSRPPTCPNNVHVINALLLKFTIRRALQERLAVSYQGRVAVQYVVEDTSAYLSVYLPSEPTLASSFPHDAYGQAVDQFVNSFINTTDPRIDDVVFHADNSTSAPSVRWGFLRQVLPVLAVISDDRNSLADQIHDIIKATDSPAAGCGQP